MNSLRQIEQLARSAVDDRDLAVLGDQHDALAHVLERELELLGLLARPRFGPQDLLDRGDHDQRVSSKPAIALSLQSWTEERL